MDTCPLFNVFSKNFHQTQAVFDKQYGVSVEFSWFWVIIIVDEYIYIYIYNIFKKIYFEHSAIQIYTPSLLT